MKHLKALAPIYIIVGWALIGIYVLFAESAVQSIFILIDIKSPEGQLLVGIVYTLDLFAGLFVLTSLIPSLMLEGKSILIQFLMVLPLVVVAKSFEVYGENFPFYDLGHNIIVENPPIGVIHLIAPYLFMLYVHTRSRKREELKQSVY